MADLVIDPLDVESADPVDAARPIVSIRYVTIAEAVIAGETLFYDGTIESSGYLRTNASIDLARSSVSCIALDSGAATATIPVAPPGSYVQLGVALTPGGLYMISPNAGKIMPYSDLATTNWSAVVGVGTSVTGVMDLLKMGPNGYALP